MKREVFLLCFLLVSFSIKGQITSFYLDSLYHSAEAEMDAVIREFDDYTEKAFRDYQEYLKRADKEYALYVKDIEEVWGIDSVVGNSYKDWVEYSPDYKSRSVVDFEKGVATVDVNWGDEEYNEREAVEKMTNAIARLLQSRGTTNPYAASVDEAKPLTDNPVLDGLIDYSPFDLDMDSISKGSDGSSKLVPPQPKVRSKKLIASESKVKPATKKKQVQRDIRRRKTVRYEIKDSLTYVAKQIAEKSVKKKVKQKTKEKKERTIVSVEIPLVSKNLSRTEILYKDIVAKYTAKFDLERAWVFAIIEQESRFKSEAVSSAGALGLMQLMPRSGGQDAYQFVYNDNPVYLDSKGKVNYAEAKRFFFDPDRNIHLGTAYLRILMNQFQKVKDVDCRRLCATAGYNTGVGNVSWSFIGNNNVGQAMPLINQYDYKGLYRHLTTKLKYEEARNYVKGVTERREKYLKK